MDSDQKIISVSNISIKSDQDCCGCSACMVKCPYDAIEMQPDIMGFVYPQIDENKCVNCGLCLKVCQFKISYDRHGKIDVPKVFALRNKDKSELNKSQSGAAFFTIAKRLLQEHGFVIYGVGLDENFLAVYKSAKTVDELENLRGSKYIQSRFFFECFKKIEKNLSEGKKVLFSGTPCQVAGLLAVIPFSLRETLYTIDIICHGVPAPNAWSQYIKWIERKYKKKVIAVDFRDKTYGWHSCRESFYFTDSQKVSRDSFRHFLMSDSHFCTRPACAKCPFTNTKRIGDLTIGDYWGWEKKHNEFNDDKGVSLVMVNSVKGDETLQLIKDDVLMIESSIEDCLQPQLQRPITINMEEQEQFKRILSSGRFDSIMRHFADEGLKYRIFRFIVRIKSVISCR